MVFLEYLPFSLEAIFTIVDPRQKSIVVFDYFAREDLLTDEQEVHILNTISILTM